MTHRPSLFTFTLAEPHQSAVRIVRRALVNQGLRIAAELDVADSIRQELGVGLAPCLLLYVDDPALLLEAVVFHRGAALLIPHPVVISGNDRHTELLVLGGTAAHGALPIGVREPSENIHGRILQALQTVADCEASQLVFAR